MTVRWFEHRTGVPEVIKALRRPEVLIDIGCGIQPQDYVVPAVHICCEPFGQYVNHLKLLIEAKAERRFCDRHFVIVQATWLDALRVFPPKSVDTVFALDVIEHLEKEDGRQLLGEAERVARDQVVIFTPLGFVPQEHDGEKDAWGFDGVQWQEHRSGWLPEDFDSTWDVYASKDFHRTNNVGRPVPEPFGALYAIKTMSHREEVNPRRRMRFALHAWVDRAFDSRAVRRVLGQVPSLRSR